VSVDGIKDGMKNSEGKVLHDKPGYKGLSGDHVVVDLYPPCPQIVTYLSPTSIPW
jgi:hypothetical protein